MSETAKAYIQNRQIGELFHALMTALMHKQPDDHIQFLIKNLSMIKEKKSISINWNMFIDNDTNKSQEKGQYCTKYAHFNLILNFFLKIQRMIIWTNLASHPSKK